MRIVVLLFPSRSPGHARGVRPAPVHRQGGHDGIVPLLHTYLSADPLCLAYEYVAGGYLDGLIQDTTRSGGMPPDMAARYDLNFTAIVVPTSTAHSTTGSDVVK